MKFSLPTEVFKNITGILTGISTRASLDESSNAVVISVSSKTIFFRVRQVDFFIEHSVASDQESEDGSVSVSIQVLESVVRTLVDSVTRVTLKDRTLVVSTSTSSSEIYILEGDDDFSVERPTGTPSLTIPREVLIHGFKSVRHAAAESVVKPEIASVYLYTSGDSLYFVATDAFRLAEMRFLFDAPKDDVGILIPIKGVQKLSRVLSGISDSSVDLRVQNDSMFLLTETSFVRMNSVKGSFPDYKSIMPSEFAIEITVLKSDVMNFLKKARFFANNLNTLLLKTKSDSEISLEFSNETSGVTRSTVPASITGSVDSLPSFNYRFVNDALSVTPDDRVIFSAMNDPTKPLMIRGVDDSTFTSIISPLLDKDS